MAYINQFSSLQIFQEENNGQSLWINKIFDSIKLIFVKEPNWTFRNYPIIQWICCVYHWKKTNFWRAIMVNLHLICSKFRIFHLYAPQWAYRNDYHFLHGNANIMGFNECIAIKRQSTIHSIENTKNFNKTCSEQ